MRRRALLSGLAVTATGGLAACLGGDAPARAPETDDQRTETTTTGTTTGTTETDASETASTTTRSTAVRCRGDPISAERSVADAPGYDDDIEYFPENRTVRYVATRTGDEPASFGTMPFSKWASIECAEVALDRVRDVLAERLGTDEFGSAIGRPPEFASTDGVVVMLYVSTRIDDGETVSTPTVSLSAVADAAPRSVKTTVSLNGDAFSRTVPVLADHIRTGAG